MKQLFQHQLQDPQAVSSGHMLACHRMHLYNLIFRTVTICSVFGIWKLQSSNTVPQQQRGQSAILTAALQPERRGLMMTILLTRRYHWQQEMCHDITFQLGSTDSDAPLLWCVYKVPLTSLIQLLNQGKKAILAFLLSSLLLKSLLCYYL